MKYLVASAALVALCATSAFATDDFWLYDSTAKTMTWVDSTGFTNVVKTGSDDGEVIYFKNGGNKSTTTIRDLDLSLPIRDASGNEYIITEIEVSAFGYDSSIVNIVLPPTLKIVKDYGFKKLEALETLTLNDGLETLSQQAFAECKALKQVNNFFPDSVVYIGSRAFYSCTSLEVGFVANNLSNFGDRAFHTSGVRSIDLGNAPITEFPDYLFYKCSSLTNVVLPDGLEKMYKGIFEGCTSIASIEPLLPKSLTYLDSSAPVFVNLTSLEGEVHVWSNLETVPLRTFRSTKIHSFVAEKQGLKTLGQYVFYGCLDLTNIVLSATMESLDYGILEGTSGSSLNRYVYLRNFPEGGVTSSLFSSMKTGCTTIYLPWEYREEWRNFAATNTAHTFTFNGQTGVLPTYKTELGTWKASTTQNVGWWEESKQPSTIILR